MPLSEHVYRVDVTFKMIKWVEQQICIKFCVKLEHSSMKTIWMIKRPKLWATTDWYLHHNNAPARASRLMQSFLVKQKITQVTQPRFGTLWLLAFSQNQNHLWKGRDYRPLMRFRKIRWGSWRQLGELYEVPRCLLWRELRHHCPMYIVSCILYLLK